MHRAALLTLAVLLSSVPAASADESLAECEEGQDWIGYLRTRPAREAFDGVARPIGVSLDACEGEQWDGQDSVAPGEPASCTPRVSTDPSRLHASMCLGPDPNGASGDDLLSPVGFRASAEGTREAYLALNVALVGRVALYGGACTAGDAGLEGATACAGTLEARSGAYARDNTVGNIVANLMPQCLLSITGCGLSEADCSQAIYAAGQYDPPSQCARDNTAIGIGLVLA